MDPSAVFTTIFESPVCISRCQDVSEAKSRTHAAKVTVTWSYIAPNSKSLCWGSGRHWQ